MTIDFQVGTTPVRFERDQLLGTAKATTPGGVLELQNPLNPSTHFSFKLEKSWDFKIGTDDITITMKRALLLGAFRPMLFRVFVNGELVTEQSGL